MELAGVGFWLYLCYEAVMSTIHDWQGLSSVIGLFVMFAITLALTWGYWVYWIKGVIRRRRNKGPVPMLKPSARG